MDNYRINLYEIEEARRLAFAYRLVKVHGLDRAAVSNPDLVDRNLNILAKLLAIREKCPVAIVRETNATCLAVPADRELQQLEYQLAPDVVTLEALAEKH